MELVNGRVGWPCGATVVVIGKSVVGESLTDGVPQATCRNTSQLTKFELASTGRSVSIL